MTLSRVILVLSALVGLSQITQVNFFITFSKSTGCVDAPTAEVQAVREACVLFVASARFSSSKLVVGCDCSNVVNWFSHPSSTPSFIKAIVVECIEVCSPVDCKVVLIPRSQNALADFLAKKEVGWSDFDSDRVLCVFEGKYRIGALPSKERPVESFDLWWG
ncbi:hypothetical protein V6N11_008304 [Hibiscus sabdariffa]|uniref:RNase H type-1 domain-containing protein n=1 Tax=Hibiscus sabdariffa TaxID=183260 RepID=A0ABR2Q0F0_9ROSI